MNFLITYTIIYYCLANYVVFDEKPNAFSVWLKQFNERLKVT